VLEEAKKYTYRSEWSKAGGGSFAMAQKKGWLEEASVHMKSPKVPMGYWTKDRLIDDAKKYESRSAWKKANASAYATALNKGCLAECCEHMEFLQRPNGFWTKEKCLQSAQQYSTIQSWAMGDPAAYDAAKRSDWYKDVIAHMTKIVSHGEYTIYVFLLQYDIKFTHQKRFKDLKDKGQLPYDFYLEDLNLIIEYQGRQHFSTSKSSMFRKDSTTIPRRDSIKRQYAKNNGFYYLEIETQKTAEIENEIKSKIEAITKTLFGLSKRDLTEVEKKKLQNLNSWTKEAVIQDAKKYIYLKDWISNGNSAYQIAQKNGWLKEVSSNLISIHKPKGYWTKDRVLASALNYQTSSEWLKKDKSAWATAQAKGWLEEATAHMPNRQKKILPK